MKKAIFLDRDGTIIKDKGNIGRIAQVEFYSFTFESLRKLQEKYILFLITNQPGIGSGFLTLDQVENVHDYILSELKKEGINIRKVYCCPHRKEDNCKCRKPASFFFKEAVKEFGIVPEASYVIGDHLSDVEFATRMNATGIYILTGHGMNHLRKIDIDTRQNIIICKNLKYAAKSILKDSKKLSIKKLLFR